MTPKKALGFVRPQIYYVTKEYLGVQIVRDVKTVSKNAKILPKIGVVGIFH
jgi:hypothetical protein